ncbi:hypothetical protein [uncultured Cocleimonas sp.]|uniref:hypothetical protein n=1 Tax=uncultured Cocleimonas sp. TaxID=1051587 RepID=UPI00262BEFBB|nr:hypothetical protein [uncultured Cocleimonas sp.]
MTIVALLYSDDNFLAISDGLISRSDGSKRLIDKDKKLVMFTPVYQIPKVSLGRFDYFSEYKGKPFCIAYAGNFTIISTVIKNFISIVNNRLVIGRDDEGKPTIYDCENIQKYYQGKNFSPNELIDITVNFLTNILERVCKSACKDFAINAMNQPLVQFILFGEDKKGMDRKNSAQVINCKGFDSNSKLIMERLTVKPWELFFIGDGSRFEEVRNKIEKAETYQNKENIDLDKPIDIFSEEGSNIELLFQNRVKVVKNEMMSVISKNVATIGGDCTIIESNWVSPLSQVTISNSDLEKRING